MNELLFEYKVRARHRLGWKEFSFYATTEIEEFLNRNRILYVRNATDTVESRLFKENKRKIDNLRLVNNKLSKELKEFKEEHKIMKQILIEQGLWETLLNDDRFLEHLRECDKSDN